MGGEAAHEDAVFATVGHIIQEHFAGATAGLHRTFLPHVELKQLVPGAIGLIRTGDTVVYANMILESA